MPGRAVSSIRSAKPTKRRSSVPSLTLTCPYRPHLILYTSLGCNFPVLGDFERRFAISLSSGWPGVPRRRGVCPPRRRAGQDWARFGPRTVIVTCCRPSARRNPGCAICAARDVAPASDWGFSRTGPWQWGWSWRACHLGEGAACPGVRAALGAIGWLAVPRQDPAGADSLG